MARRSIPSVPGVDNQVMMRRFMTAVKENVESINGARGGKIELLPYSATDAQVVDKINEIIRSMQG